MKIYLVTRNIGKLKAANNVFSGSNIEFLPVEKDYPEIQAESSLEIAKHTALQAAIDLQAPSLREDHSLFIHALGFPGPYTSYIENKLPSEKLLDLLSHYKDRSGHFEVATVYAEPNGETFEFVFQVPMTFGIQVRGINPKGWNGLIRLGNEERSITEYPEDERLNIWNQGFQKVKDYLEQNKLNLP